MIDNTTVVRGEVLACSRNQGEIYDTWPIAEGREVLFEYVGNMPEGFVGYWKVV